MEDQSICKFNQTGYCKFGETCIKIHENQRCYTKGWNPSKCKKCHPKECKYFAEKKFCKFGKVWNFNHSEFNESMKIDQFNLLFEDTNNLKAEMEMLKNTVKVIADIKQEGKVLKKSVDSLKEEIIQIK